MHLFFAFICAWPVWTDNFKPLPPQSIQIAADGRVLILNFEEPFISSYSSEGELLGSFVPQGHGPSHATRPGILQIIGSTLYIQDGGYAKTFDLNGNPKTAWPLKVEGFLRKTPGGWIEYPKLFFVSTGSHSLFWHSDDFSQSREIGKIAAVAFQVQHSFNPAKALFRVAVTRDGHFAYASDADRYRLAIFDLTEVKLRAIVQEEHQPLIFNTHWGRAMLEDHNAGVKALLEDRGVRGVFRPSTADFPEFFPPIRNLYTDPFGNLIVEEWVARPDVDTKIRCFTPTGTEIPARFDLETYKRLAAVDGDQGYVAIFDHEEERAGLAKVPLDRLDQFVFENPINHKNTAADLNKILGP